MNTKANTQSGTDDQFDDDVLFLAENSDLSPRQAKELIQKHGRDREKLLRLAQTMKAEG